ncbi:MAG: recombinase family protein [Eubacteriales bacterium]
MKTILKIVPTIPQMPVRKKVAAYARVSLTTERLQHSLSAQISYYSELIQKHVDWQYAGVYADDGISGTGTSNRDEFNRMIEDCEAGKVDIILTKSISRFARNTVDLLNTVRHLKEIGVSVRFEKENIDSLSEDGELMLTLLASFAQEESRSISDNIKWSIVQRFRKGMPNGQAQVFGYKWVEDRLTIVPEEAEIVRFMFLEYIKGASRIEIGRILNEKGNYTRQGKEWVDFNVKVVLTNITYTGNMLLQKEYIEDPITKRRKKNHGELPQFFVEDTHEAIIPMDEFQKVQAEFKRRRDLGPFGNKSLHLTAFSTKITCGKCGKHYRRSERSNTAGDGYCIWTCRTRDLKGVGVCNSKNIPEKMLQNISSDVLGIDEFNEDAFNEQIKETLVVSDDTLKFRFYDGHEVTTTWESTAKTDWWTPERRKLWGERHKHKDTNPNRNAFYEFTGFIRCERCGRNYRSQTKARKDGTFTRSWYCTAPTGVCNKAAIRDETMKAFVTDVLELDSFNEAAMDNYLEYVSIFGNTVTFHFRDGHDVTRDFKDKRRGAKWSEERREKQSQTIKATWTDERRVAASEKMRSKMK